MTDAISMPAIEPAAGDRRFGSSPILRADEVAFWTVALDGQPAEVIDFMAGVISPAEAERAGQLRFERDRRRFVVGRGILRTLLGRYAGQRADRIELRYGACGKPMLAGETGEPRLHFNLAHSDGFALYAFSRAGEVGVDVERVRSIPEWRQIAASCFSPAEATRLEAGAEAQRAVEFLRAWTRHEAMLKAAGLGLGGVAGIADAAAGSAAAGFHVYPLNPEPGYVGALAAGPAAQWGSWFACQPDAGAADFLNVRPGRRTRLGQPFIPGIHFP